MRSIRLAPAAAALLCCVCPLLALAGCGGSDGGTPSPTASASPAAGDASVFAGEYRGTWLVETEPDDKVYGRITLSGPAVIRVAADRTFAAELENTTAFTYGVFTAEAKKHTFRGTIGESGFFTGTVTTSETVKGDVIETTNTVAGSLVAPLAAGNNRYRGTVSLKHRLVTIYGVTDVFREN